VLLGLIYRPDLKEHPAWCYVPLLPFLVMVFDYAENICIIHLLRNYPNYTHVVAVAGGWFTSFKWFSFLLIVALVLSGLYRRVFKKVQKKQGGILQQRF
jgi:membrane protein implicated in regulation of membrane protease activity